MLVQLGAARPRGEELVDLLLECHERIRRFLGLAARLSEAQAAPPPEIAETAGRIRRYFSEALPKHVLDEAESLLPRLRGRSPELDVALEEMDDEHAAHEPAVARLVELCGVLERDGGALPAVRGPLAEVARSLAAELEPHLEREERVIFPAVRDLLGEEERGAIREELRRRRQS